MVHIRRNFRFLPAKQSRFLPAYAQPVASRAVSVGPRAMSVAPRAMSVAPRAMSVGPRARFVAPRSMSVAPSSRSMARGSSLAPSSYSSRYSLDDDVLYTPYRPSFHHAYDTTGNENYTRSQVNKELMMSSAAMDDNYDLSTRSRNRDRDIIAAANRAIHSPTSTTPDMATSDLPAYPKARKGTSSLRRSRSFSAAPKRPTYNTTTTVIPFDLYASPAPKPSPYLKYSVDTKSEGSQRPLYSRSVRTPYIGVRESPFRSDSPFRSPSRSGTQTPVEGGIVRNTRFGKKRYKPRVLANKRRVGNYYNRLLARRSTEGNGRESKYWPYVNVEDIGNDNVGDLFSDTESVNNYNSGGTYDRGDTYVVGNQGAAGQTYEYEDENGNRINYVYDYDKDIPDEYIPFRPKARQVSPERDYSDMSVVPYLPARDPGRSSSSDAISFNAVVAESAIRARKALERVKWDDYDSAGLVLSVEGEYHAPESETPLGFRYISRPIQLKTPASARPSVYDSDNVFTKYMKDLQSFREGIRARLDEGYKALSSESRSYTPSLALPSSTLSSTTTSLSTRPSIRPYKKRLRDDKDYKYGHSLELYPLSASGTTSARSLPSSEDKLPESRAIKLYDSKFDLGDRDSKSGISTLSKIQIKVDCEIHSSPRSAVAARRVMRGQSTPPPSIRTSYQTSSNSEAALLGSKVNVVLPERKTRTPRSLYAQNIVRQIKNRSSREEVSPPITATSGLRAHKPVYTPSLIKPIHAAEGIKKPGIMSWQYRLDNYTNPDDIIYCPRSLNSVKEQVRQVKDKLDRHKQLMDRYLEKDDGLSAEDRQVLMRIKNSRRVPAPEPALPNEAKPSDSVKKRRQKLMRKHRMEY